MNITEKLNSIEHRVLKLEKRIFEGKQVGEIYHVCTLDSYLKWIKPNDILGASGKYKNWLHNAETDWVSFTRNRQFTVETDDVEVENVLLQIVVDGDALSNSYRIGPYNDFAWDVEGKKDDTWDDPEERESEEAVKGPIKNVSKYIKEIRFDVRSLDAETIELINLTIQNEPFKYFNFIKDKKYITKYLLRQSGVTNGMSIKQFLTAVDNDIVKAGMVFNNNLNDVKEAVEVYNCDLNKSYDKTGYPLCFHCIAQNADIVNYLLANGADPNIEDNGKTPLIIASLKDNANIVKMLIDHGADVNARDNFGRTALSWAVVGNSREAARILINNGADINVRDNRKLTPLNLAHDMRMVRLLTEFGAKE